jgi:hypothetical protein
VSGQLAAGLVPDERGRRVIFNRFAKEARRCVEAALEEARGLGHDLVGDEDLLLGISAPARGWPRRRSLRWE